MALTGATHQRLEHGGEPSRKFRRGCRIRPWILCATSSGPNSVRVEGLRNDWSGEVHGWWTFGIGSSPSCHRGPACDSFSLSERCTWVSRRIAGEPWTSRCRERRQIHGCRSEALGALALGRADETGIGWRRAKVAMEIRVLGLVEASHDGRALPLGGAKPRGLLAMLALHANSPVSADRLIEGLWGDQESAKSARPGVRTGEIKALRALSAVDGVRGQVEG